MPGAVRPMWWLLAGVFGLLGWGEFVCWRVSRQHLPGADPRLDDSRPRTILVLGYPSAKGGSAASWVQRYRVRIALRSYRPGDTLLFCGGITRGATRPEAEVMADYAQDRGVPADAIVLDVESQTTWQNIENARRFIGPGPVMVASNTFHARKARGYLWRQDPSIAERLLPGSDYRLGELLLLKPLMVLYGK